MDPRLELELILEDICYSDYYQGHNHAFTDPSLLACLQFGPYIETETTNEELEDAILFDLNQQWNYINPCSQELKKAIREITDQDIREAFRETINVGDWFDQDERNKKPFKNMELGQETQIFGYIHIYLKELEHND